MSITVEDMLMAYSLAYDTWLDPEAERENPTPEYARLIRQVVEHEYADLQAENSKLRELVRDMAAVICVYDQCVTVDDCPPALPMFADKLRELGIEVDA